MSARAAQHKALPLGLVLLGGLVALASSLGAGAGTGLRSPLAGPLLALAVALLLWGAWGLRREQEAAPRLADEPAPEAPRTAEAPEALLPARAPEALEALDALQEAPLLLVTCDGRGRVVLAEGEALRVPPRRLVGQPAAGLMELLPWLAASAPRALRGERFTEVVEEEAEGGPRVLELRFRPRRDSGGRPAGFLVVGTDVTARQRREQELAEDKARQRLLLEQLPAVLWTTDERLRLTSVQGTALASLGLDAQGLMERRVGEGLLDGAALRPLRAQHRRALNGEHVSSEVNVQGRTFRVVLEPLPGAGGRGPGVLGLAHDVTDFKRSERELRSSRADLSALLENTQDALWSVDREGRVVVANSFFRELARDAFDVELRPGSAFPEMLRAQHPEAAQRWEALYARARAGEHVTDEQEYVVDGRRRAYLVSLYPIRDGGEIVGVSGFSKDVTLRRRAEEALRQSEERFSRIFHAAPLPILLATLHDGRVLDVNDSFVEASGYSRAELLGHTTRELSLWMEPQEREELISVLRREGRLVQREMHLRRKSGEQRVVLASFVQVRLLGEDCVVALAEDITEHQQLEERVRQVAKMEAVGQLAGGVAHDFNNLLTVILSHCERLQRLGGGNRTVEGSARQIQRAAARAAGLTRQLLAFGRKQMLRPVVLDASSALWELGPALRALLGEGIRLDYRLDLEAGSIRVDPMQLEQVLVNLAANARDAMPHGGQLALVTSHAEAGAREGLPEGDYVVLEVQDSGEGMSEEARSHLFEPFFTTKGLGEGSGLGLPAVYGIVRQSGGHVRVDSAPGQGTTFRLYFPRLAAPAPRAAAAPEAVLVIEREPELRALVQRVLEGEGFTVLPAHDAADAEARLRAHRGRVALAVADLDEAERERLSAQLAALRPGLRLMSLHARAPQGPPPAHDGVATASAAPAGVATSLDALPREVRRALGDELTGGAPAPNGRTKPLLH
ncbi:PAS domain S-box protein [Aggregicoccus sp. 17bor-14]|uniref:PAS domain S-box protein n=1 Tax=Myxococcaceae TaxID=31 RepID=UPI00129C4F18|nr:MULTISPECIES: PAS domain S-box protein [Myxococcaceae]MBF5042177.1 PAS domain S-box protein [Simulacricoccus sp. 17bor-14]MRI87954.1 PAS domain S-box protein [Aggregicoccus sp. 17bor-14]